MITKFDISFGTRGSKQASKKDPPNIPRLNNPFEKIGVGIFKSIRVKQKMLGMTFGKSFGGAAGGCLLVVSLSCHDIIAMRFVVRQDATGEL